MASAFNLTAQINLQGPANLKPVVAQIKRSLSGVNTDINIRIDNRAARGVDNLTSRIGVLNRALLEAARSGQTLNTSLSSLGSTINQLGSISRVNANIARTSQSITSTAQASREATSEIQEFGKQSALAVRRFAAFSVATSSIFSLINAINSGARAFVEFDSQIIKLRQTTGAGSVAIKDLESEITNLSINLGVSSEKLAQVAIVLAQAGLSANQTKQALSALAKTELTPSFENIMQTTEGAIAAMRQFNIETGDLEKALGSINAVAAAFAVESSDIVAAIQRAGGAFSASSKGVSEGVDALNEFIAVFTSVRATTRESAETIATGLRTIFTRIQRGSTIDFLREFGVELTDLDGKFVGPFEAVRRLSDVLNTLDPRDLRFSQIVEELGGFRQIGKVIPLIQQFATAQEALQVAQRGQGSLAQSQVVAQQSLANQFARVREEFLALVRAVGQSQTFQVLFKTVLGLTSGLIKLAGVLKPILPLLTILGAVKGGSALTQFAGGFFGGLKKTGGAAAGVGGDQTGVGAGGTTAQDRAVAAERANAAVAENTSSIRALTTSVQSLIQAINSSRGTGTTGFARGGIVPGRGNRDTVPAMLTPGEFVIRKKAVESIGAHNLQKANKYASGGMIKNLSSKEGYKTIQKYFLKSNNFVEDDDIVSALISKQNIKDLEGIDASNQNIWNTLNDLPAAKEKGLKYFNVPGYGPINGKPRLALRSTPIDRAEESLRSSYNANIGSTLEGIIAGQGDQYRKYKGVRGTSSSSNAPIDLIDSSGNPFEVKFKNEAIDDAEATSKLLRYKLENAQSYMDLGFQENVKKKSSIDQVDLGKLTVFESPGAEGLKASFEKWLLDNNLAKNTGGIIESIASSKGISIEQALLEQIKELGDIRGVKSLLNISQGDRTLDSVLRASNIRSGKNIPQAVEAINKALNVSRKSGLAQAKAVEAATKVAVVGLQPLDKSDIEGPIQMGSKNVVIYIRGLAKQFSEAVSKMREGISGTIRGFAENLQSQAIFGEDKPLRLDFDETLVSGADIYDKNGQIDIAGYSDLSKVQESLKKGRLTPLGEKIKQLLELDPSFSKKISVLTARPQNNAELLSKRLNELGLPIPASKITGTSGGGTTKAAALKETEKLIDDNLDNIRAARAQNKSAVQYQPVKDLSPQEQAATGLPNIEGSVLEATLTALGARGGIIQNRAVDYAMGLGPAAQYFPGIGPDWPTEVKRTLDSNSIGRAKEEFNRFFTENAQAFAQGGSAKRTEQDIKKMAVGGSVEDTVPALLTPGEFVINKKAAQKIGYSKLNKLNKADKLQGFNRGGPVGSVQKLANGGFVEDQAFARALRLMAEEMRKGASAMVAAREAAKAIEFSLPEAAKFLNEAADNYARTGDITSFGADSGSKSLLSDNFDGSSAGATAAIEVLASQTQQAADVLSLFEEQANQSGISLQKFQDNLKEQLANRALDIQSQRRTTRQDFRKQILRGKVSDLNDADVSSSIRDALTSQLTTLSGPSADANAISATVDQLMTDLADTSKSFDDIKNSNTILVQAFDATRDRSQALAAAQEELSDQLGGLTNAVKITAEELAAVDYKKSGQAAADFGFAGTVNPGRALAFKNASGGRLLNTARSFQEGAFLNKIPVIGKGLSSLGTALEGLPGPIGTAVKAIGGLPGVLSVAASMIGSEVIPSIAKSFNMGDNETLAGIGGALTQGGSMAASLGTLGNQLAGPIGGMIGTIGGAVAGAIKGFADSFQTKALENSLARLTAQTEKVNKAFEFLSKNETASNVGNAQKEVASLQTNIADLGSKAERTLFERGKDAGVGAIIGGVIGGIAGLAVDIFTGGATLLGGSATAWGAAGGTAIGGAMSGLGGPSELDNEALQAQLKAIETYVDGLNKLAERRIRLKSLDEITQVVTDFQNFNKNIDDQLKRGAITNEQALAARNNYNEQLGRTRSTAVEEAQRGALIASGYSIDQNRSVQEQIAGDANAQAIAERAQLLAAESAAMAELKRKYGDNNDLIRKESSNRDQLIKRGFELLGIEEYQASAAARLALATKQVWIETESLIDVYNRMLAGIQAFNAEIANSQIAMEQSVGVLTGNASMGRVDRRNEEVLRNPRGYDQQSFDRALNSISQLAGGGAEAKRLTSAIRANRALEERLPEIIRTTSSRDIDKVDRELSQILRDAQVDGDTARSLIDEVTKLLGNETAGRQGKSYEELSRDIPALQEITQSAEKAQQVGIALEEAKNNALEQVNRNLDQFSSLMQKSAEWTRKANEIMLQGALELDRVLGKGLSLDRLNEPFVAEIKAMTAASNGGIGTTDPVTIAENIRTARAEEERLRREIDSRSGVERDPQGELELQQLKLAQEEVGRASRDAYAALEKLATSGANAANVLSKIDERRQIGKNAASFLEKVFTQTGEEAFNMTRSFEAFQDALNGNLNFGNQRERQMAFEGMNTLLPMLTGPIAAKVQAAMLEQMLRGNGINLNRELIPQIGGGSQQGGQDALTYQDIINLLKNPEEDAATKALMQTYKELIAQQTEAANQLAKLNEDAARNSTLENIKAILERLANDLPQIAINAANNSPKPADPALVNPRPQVNANQPPPAIAGGAGARPVIQAGQVQVQSNDAPQINGPANNNQVAPNANQTPLLGANNLQNINLPVLDQIATAIPQLDTQLLNVIQAFGTFGTDLSNLQTVINNLIPTLQELAAANNGFGAQLVAFGTSTTAFGTAVTAFGLSIKNFDSYVKRLENIKLPEQIKMAGSYTLDVRVSGAAAFQSLEEKTRDIIDAEIGNKIAELEERIAKSTGYRFDPRRREP